MKRRRSSLGPWAALAVAGVLFVVPGTVRSTELMERVFEITHRSVEDAYLTIADLLGPEGEVSISKARSRLTVRDEPALLAEIGQALATFDVPPRRVRVHLRLVRAEKKADMGEELVSGVPPDLTELLRVNTFTELGQSELEVIEAGHSEVELGPDFRVGVELGEVDPLEGRVELVRLTLSKLREAVGGVRSYRVLAEMQELLRPSRLHIVSFAPPSGAQGKMLFLFVLAEIEE